MSVELAQSAAFQRAFVAMSYLLGQRSSALMQALGPDAAEAHKLASVFAHSDRNQRAAALGRELTRIADALAARAY